MSRNDEAILDEIKTTSNETSNEHLMDIVPPLLERLLALARNAALEEMASGIAHELNQPLGAIVTFAQAGERILDRPEAQPANVREVLQLISKEALDAGAAIQRMRQLFARGTLERTHCNLADVLHDLAPLLQLLARQAQVELQIDVPAELPPVSIDRLRVQHVLWVLVQNACDANRAAANAPASVRIAAQADRYGVEVSVIDAGPGIAPAQRTRIFHPFFTTKSGGTGLALACARAIIEAHEGSIGFAAAEPCGTRFWFRVPVSSASASTADHEA